MPVILRAQSKRRQRCHKRGVNAAGQSNGGLGVLGFSEIACNSAHYGAGEIALGAGLRKDQRVGDRCNLRAGVPTTCTRAGNAEINRDHIGLK